MAKVQGDYRGVPLPGFWDAWTDRDKDRWRDGVDAHYIRTVERMAESERTAGLLRVNRVYHGVLVPEDRSAAYYAGWKDGVDEARSVSPDEGRTPPEVRAFVAVTRDDPDTAQQLVRSLSARDRAVLSFWLRELDSIVSDEELSRRAEDRTRARLVRDHEERTRTSSLSRVSTDRLLREGHPDPDNG